MADIFGAEQEGEQYLLGGVQNFISMPSQLAPTPGYPNPTSTKHILKESFEALQEMKAIRTEILVLRDDLLDLVAAADIASYPARP